MLREVVISIGVLIILLWCQACAERAQFSGLTELKEPAPRCQIEVDRGSLLPFVEIRISMLIDGNAVEAYLEDQKVAVTMHGEPLEAPLATRLEAVTWFGYSITSVTSDFSPIDVAAPSKSIRRPT